MAFDQVRRRENTTTDREIYIEKDRVPKMTTHFETLVEKARDSDVAGAKETPHETTGDTVVHAFGVDQNARERHEFESLAEKVGDMNVTAVIVAKTEEEKEADQARKGREKQLEGRPRGPFAVGKFEVSAEEERGSSIESKGKDETYKENSDKEKDKGAKLVGREEGGEKPEQLSLEEIGKLRASAQKNATETIRAAEARYNKAKESASQRLNTVTEYAKEKGAQAKESVLQSTQYATEKGAQAKDTVLQGAQHVAVQAKDTVLDGAKKTSQYISEKGSETKDTAAEKIQHGYNATKDTLVSAGKTAVDYTVPQAEQAKDYALQKAVKAKDTTVDVSKNIASYAGEKAIATKDVTTERGKEAAELAGKMAVDVKDKAVAAGWSAAHYTTEKAVEGTKAGARVVDGVAEYTGHKAVEIAAKPLGAAKEAAAAAGESMKEYTARKKEAKRELEAKRSTEIQANVQSCYQQVENKEPPSESQQQQEHLSIKAKDKTEEASKPTGNVMKETFQETEKSGERQE
ncbi:hypothetical protein CRYUN_Cryun15aG0058200 [Craigia yunnanensis]